MRAESGYQLTTAFRSFQASNRQLFYLHVRLPSQGIDFIIFCARARARTYDA
jgi:hypothetical protein